ncbi:MAG: S-layer family protein [Chlorogloeopsis fritschii C42_A2020_084]|uniref:beta strand repeat-containing protein n=1 Tax=Chlorogloeopsis fritschii TaxID=1124 RepID=UPI001A0DCD5A|nr:S-layer family protein [Chlorogloeopsis fritschii]MBF2005545.1 S-layer family protein [Chlorogloeopsis fritschii C42_A2020_084]
MKQQKWHPSCKLALVILLAVGKMLASNQLSVLAQVVRDDTLGAESSTLSPASINGVPSVAIQGGATRGSNLFHSFQEFNVEAGRGVYFDNPTGIENILSRVTGNNSSKIFGKLGVLGDANLFLINPNGIIFGSEASLDLRGSFVATTASEMVFDNGYKFSTIDPQAPPLLTVNIPNGLRFRDNPGTITVQGIGHDLSFNNSFATVRTDVPGLSVQPNQTLALIGGDVLLEGGNLRAESGRIVLGSVRSPSQVNFTPTNNGFALNYSTVPNFGDISLFKKASVDVSGNRGGEVQVQAKKLSLRDGSAILSITQASEKGGNFIINASESVELIGESPDRKYVSSIDNETQGSGAGGDININTGKLIATDGAYVSTYSYSGGKGGNLNLTATDSVDLVGVGFFFSSGLYAGTDSNENAGALTINTGNLFLRERATINTSTFGAGNAGALTINTRNLLLQKKATIYSRTFGAGNGGNITINTQKLISQDGSVIASSTFNTGKAGDLTVRASELVELSGDTPVTPNDSVSASPGGLLAQADFGSQQPARGGTLTVETKRLSISNGSKVQAATFGNADAGSLIIRASDIDIFNTPDSNNYFTTGIFAGVQIDPRNTELSRGAGGSLTIETDRLKIKNGGRVDTSTFGIGNAGDLKIRASDSIEVTGVDQKGLRSLITAFVAPEAVGRGGNLRIDAKKLNVRNGAGVNVSAEGSGGAGNLEITAKAILLENRGTISADTTGAQGNILINSGDLVLRRNSSISTNATGTATGGNITINTDNLVAFPNENSDITANSFGGRGGAINITAQGIFGLEVRNQLTPKSDITAFSQLSPALNGEITLNLPIVDPAQGLLELPQTVIDPAALIAQNPCARGEGSNFVVTGRGGLPSHPAQTFSGEAVEVNLIEPVLSNHLGQKVPTNQSGSQTSQTILPAQGWVMDNAGQVLLTAYNPTRDLLSRSCPAR